jgi:YVTN family beta-propeller protein
MKTVVRIDSCIQRSSRLASVFLSMGITSFVASTVEALPKDTVVASISTGNIYVGDVVVSPDSNYLYAANNDNQTIMVIDTGTNEVTSTITVGKTPCGAAISLDGGTLYVSNAADGTVSVIATATGTVTTTVTVGSFPTYLAVSPDGNYVYVPNAFDSTVSIIETSTDQVVATVAVPSGSANEAGFSQSGLSAYVSSPATIRDGPKYLNVFDTSTQKIQNSIEFKSILGFYFAINPQGEEMYLLEKGRILLFDTVTNTVKDGAIKIPKIEKFGDEAGNAAVTPNGQYLYEPIGGSVYLVDVADKKYVNSFSPGEFESFVAIAPNGNYAYFPDALADDILVVDISSQ